jgi:beta-glucosidase/6-phospho-beta-glucosidase/beta-galactosidase
MTAAWGPELERLGLPAFRWATGIEDTFIAQVEPGKRRLDEYELQQHYRFWREDLDLVADTGFRTMRYGIPWYRVEPAEGRFDWAWTDRVLGHLLEREIEPIVDLMHYGTPLWLEDQFLHPHYPQRVSAYAAAFARRYPEVRYYTPLNEPFINAELCGRTGHWPPHLQGDAGFVQVMNAICKGIVQTVDALHQVRPDAVMVHVEATGCGLTDDETLEPRLKLDMDRILTMFELITGRVEEGHFLHPYLTTNGVQVPDLNWFRSHAIELDVIGLNYYPFMSVWRRSVADDGTTAQKAEWGGGRFLELVVRETFDRYQRPIMITESSFNERARDGDAFAAPPGAPKDTDDACRRLWLEEAVDSLRTLLTDGIPLVGFTWWPFYDLINWEYREGTGPVESYLEPMGLHRLRMDEQRVFRREPLPVATRMREIITAGDPLAHQQEPGTPL